VFSNQCSINTPTVSSWKEATNFLICKTGVVIPSLKRFIGKHFIQGKVLKLHLSITLCIMGVGKKLDVTIYGFPEIKENALKQILFKFF
jgi:hypothetical protein